MRIWVLATLIACAALGQGTASVSGRFVNILGVGMKGVTIDGASVVSDKDGSFRVSGLKPGRHHLRVSSPGYKIENVDFELEAARSLEIPLIEVAVASFGCGGELHGDRRFLPQSGDRGDLVGLVTVGDGLSSQVVGLAAVEVTVEGGGVKRATLTDRGGRYRFDGLRPGRYEVTASRKGFYVERATFKVEARFELTYAGYLGLTICLDGTCRAPRPSVAQGCE